MLIGLSSLDPQTGKTTVAKILKEDYTFRHCEISDAVGIIAVKFFGFDGNKINPKQRKILQELGICGVNIDPTLWLYATFSLLRKRIQGPFPEYVYFSDISIARHIISQEGIRSYFGKRVDGGERHVVIGGIRNPIEADEILSLGGKMILVKRDSAKKETHSIENLLNDYKNFSYIVHNDGSLEDLKEKVDNIINDIKSGENNA